MSIAGRAILDVDNTWFTLLTMDTQQLHFDAAYAAKTEWNRPLVDSTLVLALLTGMSVRTVSAKVVLYPYRMQYIADDYRPHCVKRSLGCKFVWSSNEWMTCEFGNLCRNFFGKVS